MLDVGVFRLREVIDDLVPLKMTDY